MQQGSPHFQWSPRYVSKQSMLPRGPRACRLLRAAEALRVFLPPFRGCLCHTQVTRLIGGGMVLTPDPQFAQDWAEITAGLGEHVLVPGWVRAVTAALHEASVLKFAQPRGQASARGTRPGLDVVEAGHSEAHFPDGEQCPSVADELQRVGDAAQPPPARFKL
jgi:hypothetical protein